MKITVFFKMRHPRCV